MQLGIINPVEEGSFKIAADKGLEFVEFCINGGSDVAEFIKLLPEIQSWIEKYGVNVGSIGRWKVDILGPAGEIEPKELDAASKLIDAAAVLNCRNYVCGCNYVDSLTYLENTARAISFFEKLLVIGKRKNVDISTYNCRKTNFVHNPAVWKLIHGQLKDLGIKYDPSHAIYHGGDYLGEAAEWAHRFYHVHLKGSLAVNGQRLDDPPAGLDQTDWKTFIAILYAKGYDRGLSIEPHSSIWKGELGEKGLDYTISYMRKLIL